MRTYTLIALLAVATSGVALVACARGGFGRGVGAQTDGPRDAARGDAAAGDLPIDLPIDLIVSGDGSLDLGKLAKPVANVAQALLGAPDPGSASCGRYLIALPGAWMPRTFVYQGKIHFAVPCKYDDSGAGGWHLAFASWDGKTSQVVWIDGDPAAPGVQELVNKTDPVNATESLGNVQNAALADTGSGLVGLGRRYAAGYDSYAISAPSLDQLSAAAWLLDTKGFSHVEQRDGSFLGAAQRWKTTLYANGALYIYNESLDAPTDARFYSWVSTSVDMKTVTLPAAPLAADYRYPIAAYDASANRYFLLAYSLVAEQWQLIPGTAPDRFDFQRAQSLGLQRFRGAPGAWDFTQFVKLGADQPWIVGMEILGDTLYLFYLAGEMGYVGNPPYNAPRGIGVLTLPLR